MTPRDAFLRVLNRGAFLSYPLDKPGIVIEKLPKEEREAIKKLTAADTQDRQK